MNETWTFGITDQIFPAADSGMVSLFAETGDVRLAYLDVKPLQPLPTLSS